MPFDELEMRCPRLGGPVSFGYCRREAGDGTPCFKVLDCWWQRFDVAGHLAACLPPETFAALHRPQTASKVTSLIDLIEQAKKNTGSP